MKNIKLLLNLLVRTCDQFNWLTKVTNNDKNLFKKGGVKTFATRKKKKN